LFNLNFNHSFNQTAIFSNQPQLKVFFIKQLFSNHNHNSYRNTKHTLKTPPSPKGEKNKFGSVKNLDFQMVKHKGYLLAIYIFCLNVDIRVNLNIL
jgi:hypothetical protein